MDSGKVTHSNEARTCGVASARSGRPSGIPSDARSSLAVASSVGVSPAPVLGAAEPGTQGRPDNAGLARVRVPRDPAEGWERARKTASGSLPTSPAEQHEISAGGRVTPPAWHHLSAGSRPSDVPDPLGTLECSEIPAVVGADVPRPAERKKDGDFGGCPP